MTKFIKIFLATISLVTIFNFGIASASSVFYSDACGGIKQISSTGCSGGQDTLKTISRTVVNILSILIGIISVIMLIIAGFRFITANGDANSISAARNTIVYAIVGLAIAVLAQFIVHVVLNTANTVQQNSYLNSSSVTDKDA